MLDAESSSLEPEPNASHELPDEDVATVESATEVSPPPLLCLDKPVLARDTHASKARYMAATPGIAMLAVAEHHIQTNSGGWQCVVQCCDEQTAPSQT